MTVVTGMISYYLPPSTDEQRRKETELQASLETARAKYDARRNERRTMLDPIHDVVQVQEPGAAQDSAPVPVQGVVRVQELDPVQEFAQVHELVPVHDSNQVHVPVQEEMSSGEVHHGEPDHEELIPASNFDCVISHTGKLMVFVGERDVEHKEDQVVLEVPEVPQIPEDDTVPSKTKKPKTKSKTKSKTKPKKKQTIPVPPCPSLQKIDSDNDGCLRLSHNLLCNMLTDTMSLLKTPMDASSVIRVQVGKINRYFAGMLFGNDTVKQHPRRPRYDFSFHLTSQMPQWSSWMEASSAEFLKGWESGSSNQPAGSALNVWDLLHLASSGMLLRATRLYMATLAAYMWEWRSANTHLKGVRQQSAFSDSVRFALKRELSVELRNEYLRNLDQRLVPFIRG